MKENFSKLALGLQTAAFTLASEYAWMGTGTFLKGANLAESTLAHGMVGGGLNAVQGGSFKNGFLAAATSQALSGEIAEIHITGSQSASIMARGMAAGVVGGTVAAATGGNFENGMMTSAAAQIFNDDNGKGESWLGKTINNLTTSLANYWQNYGNMDTVNNTLNALGPIGGAIGGGVRLVGEGGAAASEAADAGVEVGTKIYRVFGDEAQAMGHSWTTTDPGLVDGYRNAAGLPDVNSGRFIIEGSITDTTGITFRPALSLDGNDGGLAELLVPRPSSQIQINRVSGINPEY